MRASADVKLLQAVDHVKVVYRRWQPPGETRATVQIVHGASEHSARYGRLADALVERGLAVYAMDLRGHGRTAEGTGIGRFGGMGRFGGLGVERVLDDVAGLHRVMTHEHPGVHRILIGHSMGSIIALAAAERDGDDLSGLVLSGPIGVAPELVDSVTALDVAVASGMGDQVLDALGAFNQPFEPARTPFDWLSRDPAEVDAYIHDPLCGEEMPLTHAYAAGVFGLAVRAASPEAVADLPDGLPVLLMSGEHDPVGGVDGSRVTALAEMLRARGLPVEQHLYPEARHEVFNELNREAVTTDLLTWLDQRLG